MKSVLFTFDTEEARDKFVKSAQGILDIHQPVETVLDPTLEHELSNKCAVFVAGQKLVEGDQKDMMVRFTQECGVHSASVILKQFKNGVWSAIKTRQYQ
tara:strand:- start:2526 stop:2822 length:297 start_codon:yes stop_codon:yes gene_type:complete